MSLELKPLRRADIPLIIDLAITGMHFDWYVDHPFLLSLYGKYVWYLELSRATQILACYAGDTLAGVLLADMKGEAKLHRSFWQTLYVRIFDFFQRLLYRDVNTYGEANQKMLATLHEHQRGSAHFYFRSSSSEKGVSGSTSTLIVLVPTSSMKRAGLSGPLSRW